MSTNYHDFNARRSTSRLYPNLRGDSANRAGRTPPTTDETERAWPPSGPRCWGEMRSASTTTFFDIGGDSIRSIQVVARAGTAGWKITPKQLFQNQTIAELAQVAVAGPHVAQKPVWAGTATADPARVLLARRSRSAPSQSDSRLTVSPPATPAIIERAFQEILTHHDQLRARVQAQRRRQLDARDRRRRRRNCCWKWSIYAIERARAIDRLEHAATTTQAGLDFGHGPVARFVYFDYGADRPARLLCAIHHLVVDAVSWRLLLRISISLPSVGRGLSGEAATQDHAR